MTSDHATTRDGSASATDGEPMIQDICTAQERRAMDFELSEEHRVFADSVRRFAQDKLASGALERAHSREYPWEWRSCWPSRGCSASRSRSRRRAGRHSDACRAGDPGSGAGLPEKRRHRPSRQLRPDPHLRRIRLGRAEGPISPGPTRRKEADRARYERAGSGFGSNRAEDLGRIEDGEVRDQRQQGVLHPQPRCRTLPDLRAVRAGVDGIGSVLVERDTPGFPSARRRPS